MGSVRQKLSQRRSSIIMALRRVPLLAVVVVLASVDLVTADGDKFHGKDCRSDDDCGPISFCDNSVKGSVGAKVLGTLVGKVSNTAGAAVEAVAGECRVSPTFWAVFSIVLIAVVSSIVCGCLCCSFCPLYHLGRGLRPGENV